MDIKEFIKQVEEFKGFDQDHINKNKKKFLELSQSHPWTIMRAHEILKWVESGRYQQILDIHCKDNIDEIDKTCLKCGTKFKGNETFCSKCGSKLWKKTCPSCGTELKGSEAFCGICGQKLWTR